MKHRVMWFYLSTLLLTIVLGGVGQAICANYIPEQYRLIVSLVMVQMAPTLGVLVVCMSTRNFSYLQNMGWNPLKDAKDIWWLLISLIIPIAIVAGASVLMTALGKGYISNGYSSKMLTIMVLGSFLGCIGEEIGWRGYMLPSLKERFSLFSSAVTTGLFWGIWHFGKIASSGFVGYVLFIVLVTAFSLIMAWIHARCGRKIIHMVCFHFGINVSSILLLAEREGVVFYTLAIAICAVVYLATLLIDSRKPTTELSPYQL